MYSPRHMVCGAALALAALGCAQKGLSPLAAESPKDALDAVRPRLVVADKPKNASGQPLAIVVSGAPGAERTLVAVDLASGQTRWTQKGEVTTKVAVGGALVAHGGKGTLVLRDVATGAVRAEVPVAGAFVGVDCDDAGAYATTMPTAASARVVGVDPAGKPRWAHDVAGQPGARIAGTPVVVSGHVLLPLSSQYIAVLDGQTGREVLRLRSRDAEVTFVQPQPGALGLGSGEGVFAFPTDQTAFPRDEQHFTTAVLPGGAPKRVRYGRDAYATAEADASALDRNRLLWWLEPGGKPVLGRQAALHVFRYVFGFDATAGADGKIGVVRFAYVHPRVEIVQSEHTGGAILAVAEDGELFALDPGTGAKRSIARVPGPVVGASFDAGLFAAGATAAAGDVVGTLAQIVWDRDVRYASAKAIALDAIAAQPGAQSAKELLRVVDSELPGPLQQRAADLLVGRKDKASLETLLEVALRRYDHVTSTQHPPVDVVARAIAATGDKGAVARLVMAMHDPALSAAASQEIVDAALATKAKEALPELVRLLRAGHADADVMGSAKLAESWVKAVLGLGGKAERELCDRLSNDPRTAPALKAALGKLL